LSRGTTKGAAAAAPTVLVPGSTIAAEAAAPAKNTATAAEAAAPTKETPIAAEAAAPVADTEGIPPDRLVIGKGNIGEGDIGGHEGTIEQAIDEQGTASPHAAAAAIPAFAPSAGEGQAGDIHGAPVDEQNPHITRIVAVTAVGIAAEDEVVGARARNCQVIGDDRQHRGEANHIWGAIGKGVAPENDRIGTRSAIRIQNCLPQRTHPTIRRGGHLIFQQHMLIRCLCPVGEKLSSFNAARGKLQIPIAPQAPMPSQVSRCGDIRAREGGNLADEALPGGIRCQVTTHEQQIAIGAERRCPGLQNAGVVHEVGGVEAGVAQLQCPGAAVGKDGYGRQVTVACQHTTDLA